MKKLNNTKKRELRNRKKLKTVSNRYRVSVFKSLNNISAQIIDDKEKKTLVSASSIEKEMKANIGFANLWPAHKTHLSYNFLIIFLFVIN